MLLTCSNVSKSYAGIEALHDVSLDLKAGEIHGLVGANGAGKSTLMKILSGALSDFEGTITLQGEPLQLGNPHEALAHGIAMVYQELSGVGKLSVAENLFLGRQPQNRFGMIDWKTMDRRAVEILATVGLELDITRPLAHYSLSIRQMIEIARCLQAGSRLFILDEPTSALSPPEKERLFQLLHKLKNEGKGIVFVSHFIEEILEVCDRVTILVDGRLRSTLPTAQLSKHEVIHEMLDGKDLSTEEAMEEAVLLPPKSTEKPLVQLRSISLKGAFSDISLQVSPGESLGLYGFVGAGHQELAHCLSGSQKADGGELLWQDQPVPLPSPHRAVQMGIAFVAADRTASIVPQEENFKNITIAHLDTAIGHWVTPAKEIAVAAPCLEKVGCQPPDPRQKTGSLSGGNQQKVVLGKWLLGDVLLLVLEEPTRGMDVGAKREVMDLVRDLKKSGAAVLIASSEPELLLAHADRILVMRRGVVTRELFDCRVDKAELMRHA